MLVKDEMILGEDVEHPDNLLADDLKPTDKFFIKREICALKLDKRRQPDSAELVPG